MGQHPAAAAGRLCTAYQSEFDRRLAMTTEQPKTTYERGAKSQSRQQEGQYNRDLYAMVESYEGWIYGDRPGLFPQS